MIRRFIFLAALLLVATAARAQQWSVYASGGKSITTWHGQADLSSLNVEWTKQRWRNTEVGVIVAPHFVYQPRSWFGDQYGDGSETVRAISGSLLFRRTFGRFYLEASTGPMWAEKQVPASTSRFNFITQPGFGVVLRRESRTPIIVGYRFAHISNGGYARRNPGLGISELILGVRLASSQRPTATR